MILSTIQSQFADDIDCPIELRPMYDAVILNCGNSHTVSKVAADKLLAQASPPARPALCCSCRSPFTTYRSNEIVRKFVSVIFPAAASPSAPAPAPAAAAQAQASPSAPAPAPVPAPAAQAQAPATRQVDHAKFDPPAKHASEGIPGCPVCFLAGKPSCDNRPGSLLFQIVDDDNHIGFLRDIVNAVDQRGTDAIQAIAIAFQKQLPNSNRFTDDKVSKWIISRTSREMFIQYIGLGTDKQQLKTALYDALAHSEAIQDLFMHHLQTSRAPSKPPAPTPLTVDRVVHDVAMFVLAHQEQQRAAAMATWLPSHIVLLPSSSSEPVQQVARATLAQPQPPAPAAQRNLSLIYFFAMRSGFYKELKEEIAANGLTRSFAIECRRQFPNAITDTNVNLWANHQDGSAYALQSYVQLGATVQQLLDALDRCNALSIKSNVIARLNA